MRIWNRLYEKSEPRLRVAMLALLALAAIYPAADAATARQGYTVGFLGLTSAADHSRQTGALRQGLRDLGYEEGKNLVIEYRWAERNLDLLPALAAELVGLKVDVIVTHGSPGSRAAKQATAEIPIVIAVVGDPVGSGVVASLSRPGGERNRARTPGVRVEREMVGTPEASRAEGFISWLARRARCRDTASRRSRAKKRGRGRAIARIADSAGLRARCERSHPSVRDLGATRRAWGRRAEHVAAQSSRRPNCKSRG